MAKEKPVVSSPMVVASTAKKPNQELQNSVSAVKMIAQSLQSGDKQLLETAIAISDPQVIEATCKELPLESVLPFMEQLITRMHSKPSRALQVILWMQPLLFNHILALSSIPNSFKVFNTLKKIIDDRLSTRSDLLRVSAKLDFVLGRLEHKTPGQLHHSLQKEQMLTTPMAIYDDDDDEIEFEYVFEKDQTNDSIDESEEQEDSEESE